MTSSNGITLDRLNDILIEEEEQKSMACLSLHDAAQKHLDLIWARHGMQAPFSGHWIRPFASTLYKTPLSAPQTTLTTWDSLPKPIQEQLTTKPNADGIVEVPFSLLVPNDADAGGGTTTQRPLGGNLTSKLKEYTRGVSGQTKPFRAGGMDPQDAKENPYHSDEAIARSLKVLEQGVESSWKDGTLLTAPPGVEFDVGLSWKQVYKTDSEPLRGQAKIHTIEDKVDQAFQQENSEYQATSSYSTQGMWERSYFDDDSLFGATSSEEEDDSDGDQEDLVNDEVEATEEEATDSPFRPITKNESKVDELASTDTLDVDDLLSALAIDEYATNKKSLTELPNPLQLAQEHSAMAQDMSRKAWAVTKLLPIEDFNSWIPNPAISYPFTLDDFQQQAVARIERSESIFVAAHTSAGKTVCAEYAIALCKQHCTRAVYTSPIKALSNQKFRDFCQTFGTENVGLVTGDMQINVDDSTVLIMTTEILRSMLYRGADLIRDIEWVIFDEVHYVNDSERGVVWEEVIIMLPQYVNMIFLSATTPNTIEFSDWIGRTKRKPVHVIRTSYRPVPLSHFLWAGLKLHKIMEGKSGFIDLGHKEATKALKPIKEGKSDVKPKRSNVTGSKQLAWQQSGSKANWVSLVRFLEREGLMPTVVFSFSKKKCEEIANMLRSLDLNTASERSAVQGFAIQTVARLSPSDSKLPQVLTVCEMVARGIGVHHGGLLPILKEMVEILFSRNLIKVLFATETFAMGVNMPARCVVFNAIRKHDGTQFRELEPGEYTQMAGRAGRRGLDKVGTVIMCCFGETPPPLPILRNMLTGLSTKLQSQFRLTYNMILNLLRVEDMSVEGMIKRSFSEFATQRALNENEYPKLLSKGEKTLAKLDAQFKDDADSRLGAEDLEEYYQVASQVLTTNDELLSYIVENVGGDDGEIFIPGRVLLVTAARIHGYVRTPAIIIRGPDAQLRGSSRASNVATGKKSLTCLVLLPETFLFPEDEKAKVNKKPATLNYIGEAKRRHYAIHELQFNEVVFVCALKHKIEPHSLLSDDPSSSAAHGLRDPFAMAVPSGRRGMDDFGAFAAMTAKGKKKDDDFFGKKPVKKANTAEAVEEIVGHLVNAEKKEREGTLGVLNIRNCVKQGNDVLEYRQHCDKMEDLVATMRSFASHRHPAIEAHYASFERRETLRQRIQILRHLLSNESLQLFPDFLQRKAVLQTLGYVDDKETVCVKGRVACEVNTAHELIATEMVFEGILNELDPAEIVAALSALVYQEKKGNEEFDAELPETLLECCQRMKLIATNLGMLQKEHGLDVDPADFCESSLKFGLVHVVYEWALGVTFRDICDLTDVQEGSIVRCITRLDELCREIRNCARVVGNPTLYGKMEAASMAIKRDIVFASSLYVS